MFKILLLALVVSATAIFVAKTVYESPSGLILENIAVRQSSQLLLTSTVSPTLHTLDPRSDNATLDAVYTFPNSTGLSGIAEYQPDVFAVAASRINVTARRTEAGSISIWRVAPATGTAEQVSRGITNGSINGLSSVPGYPDLVLAAESVGGAVYEVNMLTGATRVAMQNAAVLGPGDDAPAPSLGINGMHARAEAGGQLKLYFTNSEQGTFARVPIAVQGGQTVQDGEFEVLGTIRNGPANSTHAFDDFALESKPGGAAWVSVHPGALSVFYPLYNGTWVQENVAGNPQGSSAVFTEPTSAAFGRGEGFERTLFVTTAGGQIVAVNTGAGI